MKNLMFLFAAISLFIGCEKSPKCPNNFAHSEFKNSYAFVYDSKYFYEIFMDSYYKNIVGLSVFPKGDKLEFKITYLKNDRYHFEDLAVQPELLYILDANGARVLPKSVDDYLAFFDFAYFSKEDLRLLTKLSDKICVSQVQVDKNIFFIGKKDQAVESFPTLKIEGDLKLHKNMTRQSNGLTAQFLLGIPCPPRWY